MSKDREIWERVQLMAGENGWWHPHNGETVYTVVLDLVLAGVPRELALISAETIVGAVADEYGA